MKNNYSRILLTFLMIICSQNLFVISSSYASSNKSEDKEMSFNYKDQSEIFWKKHLKEETFNVCRKSDTERAGSGKYDKFYEEGTYYCACCGGDYAVYSSKDKFDSGTGWPSFYKPVEGGVTERPDPNDTKSYFGVRQLVGYVRTEVVCARCHSHLGHVFDDVDQAKGKRYCMNSAALSFNPKGQQPISSFNNEE